VAGGEHCNCFSAEEANMSEKSSNEVLSDRVVLLIISGGLITILLTIIVGIYLTTRALPNWAENVLVSIGTAAALKLGDCLATLVALAGGRQVERLGTQLAGSQPSNGADPLKVTVDNPPDDPVPVEPQP
jgi:hypothetical protein